MTRRPSSSTLHVKLVRIGYTLNDGHYCTIRASFVIRCGPEQKLRVSCDVKLMANLIRPCEISFYDICGLSFPNRAPKTGIHPTTPSIIFYLPSVHTAYLILSCRSRTFPGVSFYGNIRIRTKNYSSKKSIIYSYYDKIRFSKYFWMYFKLYLVFHKNLSHNKFNLGVCSVDVRHYLRSLFGRKYISQFV